MLPVRVPAWCSTAPWPSSACSSGSHGWWNDWSASWRHPECHGWNIAFYSYTCPKTCCPNLTQFWTCHRVKTAINLQKHQISARGTHQKSLSCHCPKTLFAFSYATACNMSRALRAGWLSHLHANGASQIDFNWSCLKQKSKMVWLRFRNVHNILIIERFGGTLLLSILLLLFYLFM